MRRSNVLTLSPSLLMLQCREAVKGLVEAGMTVLAEVNGLLSQSGRLPPPPLENLTKDVEPILTDLAW
jgi:hypothetical protein